MSEPVPERPPRMSMGRVVELLLARGAGEKSSVSLNRNAKGETQIEVVVRTAEAGDVQTVEAAASAARAIYDDLCARYPTSSGHASHDATTGTPTRKGTS